MKGKKEIKRVIKVQKEKLKTLEKMSKAWWLIQGWIDALKWVLKNGKT